jgi:hypothetical protein
MAPVARTDVSGAASGSWVVLPPNDSLQPTEPQGRQDCCLASALRPRHLGAREAALGG